MTHLYELIPRDVAAWREDSYPAITEILNYATLPGHHIIWDQAANLQPKERVEARYLVPVGDITSKGEKV